MDITDVVVSGYALLTIAGQVIALVLLVILLFRLEGGAGRWVGAHGLGLMLAVALLATAGSLYFSEIAGWTPCKLCWFQRIFMYPQVFLLAFALWKRDRGIAPYILILSVIGLLFASYHYGEQVWAALHPVPEGGLVPCDETGVSCRSTPFFRFGYVTIPLMAATAFLLNILGSLITKKRG